MKIPNRCPRCGGFITAYPVMELEKRRMHFEAICENNCHNLKMRDAHSMEDAISKFLAVMKYLGYEI